MVRILNTAADLTIAGLVSFPEGALGNEEKPAEANLSFHSKTAGRVATCW